MKLGIHIVNLKLPDGPRSIAPTLQRIAQTAERMDCASISVMDHYFQMEAYFPAEDEALEAYTMLGYLAACTTTLQLRVLVTGVTYRYPGLLAKIVTTADIMSGGRAELGLGAAWYEREHLGLGVPYPPLRERFERLEETIQICKQMWSEDNGPFQGKHFKLEETLCSPQPLSEPHPPIMIGGGGEKKTLRLVAKYADACNLFSGSLDEIRHKLEVLKSHCQNEGRNYGSIKKTLLYVGGAIAEGDPEAFVEEMKGYAELGFEEVYVSPPGEPIAFLQRLGDATVDRLSRL